MACLLLLEWGGRGVLHRVDEFILRCAGVVGMRETRGACVSELLCVLWRGVHVALCIYLLGWLDMTPLSEGSQRGGQYK